MTEPDASPPQDPAQNVPLEQRAEAQDWPSEQSLREKQFSAPPPPSPPPAAPPMMLGMAAPQEPSTPPPQPPRVPERAPLPPPYSPPPPRPESAPFEPLPPGAPPQQPPASPPYSGGSQPIPGAPILPRGTGWPAAAHWTSLFGLGFSCILVPMIGPLIVWLAKKDENPECDWHGRESLNFQVNMLILWLVALPLYCLCGLGALIHAIQPIYAIVMAVIASIQAGDGKRFRYPFTMRLLND